MFNRMEIRGALTAAALIAAFALAGVHVPIGIPGQPILETLRFHLAALLFLLGLCLVIAGGRYRAILFGLVAIASVAQGLWVINRQQAVRPPQAELAGLPSISVLHFNMLFNNSANGRAIANMIRDSGAAFAILPEALPVAAYLPELRKTYVGQIGCTAEVRCDLLLLSRFRLTEAKVRSLGKFSASRIFTAYADVDGTRVAVVAVHLTKPYFDDAARGEILALGHILRSIDGPVIMTGDFNAAPWSQNLQNLLRWGKLIPAPSYPPTWPPEIGVLGVPIDNIFTRGPAVVSEIVPLADTMGSNHRGLMAKVVVVR